MRYSNQSRQGDIVPMRTVRPQRIVPAQSEYRLPQGAISDCPASDKPHYSTCLRDNILYAEY